MTFEQAYKRLQEIHLLLQSDDVVNIDDLLKLQEEAKSCYELCNEKLKAVEE